MSSLKVKSEKIYIFLIKRKKEVLIGVAGIIILSVLRIFLSFSEIFSKVFLLRNKKKKKRHEIFSLMNKIENNNLNKIHNIPDQTLELEKPFEIYQLKSTSTSSVQNILYKTPEKHHNFKMKEIQKHSAKKLSKNISPSLTDGVLSINSLSQIMDYSVILGKEVLIHLIETNREGTIFIISQYKIKKKGERLLKLMIWRDIMH